jgi:hypothetical protein
MTSDTAYRFWKHKHPDRESDPAWARTVSVWRPSNSTCEHHSQLSADRSGAHLATFNDIASYDAANLKQMIIEELISGPIVAEQDHSLVTGQVVRDIRVFGVDPAAHHPDGTPAPIDREALQRIADKTNSRIADGARPALTSCNTSNLGDDQSTPEVLGYVDRVRVEGDLLLADLAWLDGHLDQIPLRRWFTPELWTDRKTGEQWIDPVVAHTTREELRTGLSWIPDSPPATTELQSPQETAPLSDQPTE